jgi:hypothetical protein
LSERSDALAALHRRYDGPIEARLRETALLGEPSPDIPLVQASRDLDRLAFSTVASLARLRANAGREAVSRLCAERTVLTLTVALRWYRMVGVQTIDRHRHANAPLAHDGHRGECSAEVPPHQPTMAGAPVA